MIRALNQRQSQAPMRFFEAGTQGMWANVHVGFQNASDQTTDPAHWYTMNERRVNTYPGGLTEDEHRYLLSHHEKHPTPNLEPLYRAETVRYRRVKEQRQADMIRSAERVIPKIAAAFKSPDKQG